MTTLSSYYVKTALSIYTQLRSSLYLDVNYKASFHSLATQFQLVHVYNIAVETMNNLSNSENVR
jgi:hypothetical protein